MTYKQLTIPEWLFDRISREKHAPRVWSGDIVATYGETEKAYKVLLAGGSFVCWAWVPKSVAVWVDTPHDYRETRRVETFEQAAEWAADIRALFN